MQSLRARLVAGVVAVAAVGLVILAGVTYAEQRSFQLDRIDQQDGALDGLYRRHDLGAGTVVYVMDTGVLATHAEFANAAGDGSRVIAGFDVTRGVTIGSSNLRCHDTVVSGVSGKH